WWIPVLFCLWANTHGSWLIGLVIFAIITASGLLEGNWGRIQSVRWSPSQLRKLIVTGLGGVAALFLNPFGWRLVVYPIEFGSKLKLPIARVSEWMSVNFHDDRGKVVLLLLVGVFLAVLLRDRRLHLSELGLILLGLYSGLTYIRFLCLLAIVAAPVVAKMLDFLPPYDAASDKPVLNAALMAVMVIGTVHYFPLFSSSALDASIAKEYPVQLVQYLRTHPPEGRVLNFYNWGGYLGWRNRDFKVFI